MIKRNFKVINDEFTEGEEVSISLDLLNATLAKDDKFDPIALANLLSTPQLITEDTYRNLYYSEVEEDKHVPSVVELLNNLPLKEIPEHFTFWSLAYYCMTYLTDLGYIYE